MAVTAAQHQRTVQCSSAAVLNIVLCNSQVFPRPVVVTGEYSQLANGVSTGQKACLTPLFEESPDKDD